MLEQAWEICIYECPRSVAAQQQLPLLQVALAFHYRKLELGRGL